MENEYFDLKNKLKESLPYLKEKFLNELIQINVNSDEIEKKLKYFNIDIKNDVFRTAVFEILDENGNIDEEVIILKRLQVMDTIKRHFIDEKYVNIFLDNSHRIVLLCNDKDIDLPEICENIKDRILNEVQCIEYRNW